MIRWSTTFIISVKEDISTIKNDKTLMFSTANLSIFINLLFFFFFLPLSSLNFKRVFIQRQITLNLSGSYVYGVEYYFVILRDLLLYIKNITPETDITCHRL